MTKVPEAAIKAAAAAHLEARGDANWGDVTKQGRDNRLRWMSAALEAAAPYMLWPVYDEGWAAARDFYLSEDGPEGCLTANPYRSKT